MQGAQLILEEELRKGHVKLDQWLKKNGYPRLPLPYICGYIPLVAALKSFFGQKVSLDVNPI